MFVKYNSLTNHTDKKFLNKLLLNGFCDPSIKWFATEKIHGTNFSFIVNSDTVTCAKRTDVISESESFFDYEVIENRYHSNVCVLFTRAIDMNHAHADSVIQVYGEYAGTTSGGSRIQKSIDYGAQDFYVFDIRIDGVLQNRSVVERLVKAAGLKTAPLIAVGTFDELIQMRNDFNTLISEWNDRADDWDASKIMTYDDTNMTEGFVMRPMDILYLGDTLIAVKHKNPKFSERKNATPFVAPIPMSDADKAIMIELETYVTENRLNNVLSKTGVPNVKQFGRVSGLMMQDILAESDGIIDKAEQIGLIKKQLMNSIGTLIRPKWVNICNGDF
ncbi:MAG: hypothetical protein [Caudoviricetes sp.]|nr:MAG: hypothetical protein [Caudoviricetes sp.]